MEPSLFFCHRLRFKKHQEKMSVFTYLLGLLCFRRLLLLFIGTAGVVCCSLIVLVDSIVLVCAIAILSRGSNYRAVIVKFSFFWNSKEIWFLSVRSFQMTESRKWQAKQMINCRFGSTRGFSFLFYLKLTNKTKQKRKRKRKVNFFSSSSSSSSCLLLMTDASKPNLIIWRERRDR